MHHVLAEAPPARTQAGSRTMACEACRKSKLKCEMVFPCRRCVRLKIDCADPRASGDEEWLAAQLTVRHGLSDWLEAQPDDQTQQTQRLRCRLRRIHQDKALRVLMCTLEVYRKKPRANLLSMLQAWSVGLQVDLSEILRGLEGKAVERRRSRPSSASHVGGSLQEHRTSPMNDALPERLLHPYLGTLFISACLTLCAVYRDGEARMFGNDSWYSNMHDENGLRDRHLGEKMLPEAIFASVMVPREREHFVSCLDHCLFGSAEGESEVVQVMECEQPATGNHFQGLMRLRVVVEDGYVGIIMSLQVLPFMMDLDRSAPHRSNFMSCEKIIDSLVSRRRKRSLHAQPLSEGESGSMMSGPAASATATMTAFNPASSSSSSSSMGMASFFSSSPTAAAMDLAAGSQACNHACSSSSSSSVGTKRRPKSGGGKRACPAKPPLSPVLGPSLAPVPVLATQPLVKVELADGVTDDDGNRDSTATDDLLDWVERSPSPMAALRPNSPPAAPNCPIANFMRPPSVPSVPNCAGASSLFDSEPLGPPPDPPRPSPRPLSLLPDPSSLLVQRAADPHHTLPGAPGPLSPTAIAAGHGSLSSVLLRSLPREVKPVMGGGGGYALHSPSLTGATWVTADGQLVDDSNRDSSTTCASDDLDPQLPFFMPSGWGEAAMQSGGGVMGMEENGAGHHHAPHW